MCPMNPRLLRPTQNQHPEAGDWANRVRTNGGTVSGSTLLAVSRFCRAIDAAGIRDRFYRLNLFAGNSDASLNAVRTPLYRGQSRTGTQYGNTIDTNVNFVSGDYSLTVGLTGGTGKYLTCGTGITSGLTPADSHLMAFGSDLNQGDSVSAIAIGVSNAGFTNRFYLQTRSASASLLRFESAAAAAGNIALASGMVVGTAISSTDSRLFVNGSQEGITTTTNRGSSAYEDLNLPVFALAATSPQLICKGRLVGYSVGLGLTGTQVTAYRAAYLALLASLGRTV